MTEPTGQEGAVPWQLQDMGAYEFGLIRLVTYLRNLPGGEREARLIFGAVELLPKEIEPPESLDWVSKALTGLDPSRTDRIFYTCATVSAEKALRWYEECRVRGFWFEPTRDLDIDFVGGSRSHPLTPLLEEPEWPQLAVNTHDRQLPIVPRCWDQVSTHHLLASDNNRKAPWHPDQSEVAIDFASSVLGLDITDWSELLGSVHLIVPDPLIRQIRTSLDEAAGALILSVDARLDVDIPELECTVWQQRISGVDRASRHSISPGVNKILIGEDPKEIGIIMRSEFGLHMFQPPTAFLKSIQIKMNVAVRRTVRIEGFGEPFEYSAPSVLHNQINVGEPAKPGGSLVLAVGRERRKQSSTARDRQFWFDDEKERAHDLVRRLIGSAAKRVVIVDPYFESQAALRFCPAMSASSLKVKILSSHFFLKKRMEPETDLTNESRLLDAIDALKTKNVDNFEIRKLRGSNESPVHDRLLVVDDRAWLLGSSFKDFGSRGTMLVELHEPNSIVRLIESYWNEGLILQREPGFST